MTVYLRSYNNQHTVFVKDEHGIEAVFTSLVLMEAQQELIKIQERV